MTDTFSRMSDEQSVLEANAAFYGAFEALDADAMAAVWSNTSADVCIHPGWDLLIGERQVQESWSMIFANTSYLRFEASDVRVSVAEDMATVSCIENIFSVIEGHTVHSRMACTNVFRRSVQPGGSWEMVVHHASPIAAGQTVVRMSDDDGGMN